MLERQGGRQGGVPAEGHLTAGGEPAKPPLPVALALQEGCFRLLQPGGEGLHPIGLCGGLQQHHGGTIAL